MWVIDAVRYLVCGSENWALLVPSLLAGVAWLFWLRGPRAVGSFRAGSLLGAMACATVAVLVHWGLIAWWRVIHPWLYPHQSYCPSVPWADLATFLSTGGALILALVGVGPGRIPVAGAALVLCALRACMW
jgi:hypothetical protein